MLGICCLKNLYSTYKIGKRIIKKIDSVTNLLHKGEPFYSDSAIAVKLPRLQLLVTEWPLEKTVGLDSAVERSHYFDAVIWTKVPREEDYIEKVQGSVRKKLDIPDAVWNQGSGEDEKGAQIFSVLNGKKFVILLDDLWEQFNLLRLGIHLRNDQNQSKLIFTARSLGLYFDMDMEATVTVHVECLPPEQASSLFKDDCR
ncbi:hypothetical protein PTKIN_Ptkin19aG0082700 [Pterospermum kingtungense]